MLWLLYFLIKISSNLLTCAAIVSRDPLCAECMLAMTNIRYPLKAKRLPKSEQERLSEEV